MSRMLIANGTVYDPANGVEGVHADVWIEDESIVSLPKPPAAATRVIDASGLVVFPGGIDVHCHVASAAVNAARRLGPLRERGVVPSTIATGRLYAGLGYTTLIDAAVAPVTARHAHEQFTDTPIVDKGMLLLLGNDAYALSRIAAGDQARLNAYAGWLLGACRGYGIKLVDPGAVEAWKQRDALGSIDSPIGGYGCTPRQIIAALAQATLDLSLPHPLHLHCNHLGLPGNADITLESMRVLEGRRAHFAHLQFHSYGGTPDDPTSYRSAVPALAAYFNNHPNLTGDVGQVLFGSTMALTADGPVGEFLHEATGRKWYNADIELETGCGVLPLVYRPSSLVHALQWAIGLEWFLMAEDPWRIALSTDHPNGASFLAYPEVIQLLMDRAYRTEVIRNLPSAVAERTVLRDLDREYTLAEIAVISRAAPARILGLPKKGHLGPGADADVTLYQPNSDRRAMFSLPRYVLKSGRVVVDGGALRELPQGRTLSVSPLFEDDALSPYREWVRDYCTTEFASLGAGPGTEVDMGRD